MIKLEKISFNPKFIFLTLTIFTGIIVRSQYIDYIPMLSQGDHGLVLYAAQMSLDGVMPYKGYTWFYGPFMPAYYGLFLKLTGISIPSILLGKAILELLSGVFIYLIMSLFVSPFLALVAALWFWAFDPGFFYTFNHLGGVTFILASLYSLCLYLYSSQVRHLFISLMACFILSLIKLNIGLATAAALVSCVLVIDFLKKIPLSINKKIFHLFSIIILFIISIAIYWHMTKGLPFYEIKQNLQYFNNDYYSRGFGLGGLFINLYQFWLITKSHILIHPIASLICLTVLISFVRLIFLLRRKQYTQDKKSSAVVFLLCLFIFWIFLFHEFIISGIGFRLEWGQPLQFLLMFIVIDYGLLNIRRYLKYSLYSLFLLFATIQFLYSYQTIQRSKNPSQYLSIKNGKVFVGNPSNWVAVVIQTAKYLEHNLKKDELFFAFPYEPIYYFLAKKRSPSRQIIFFEFVNIPAEQEEKVIEELNKKNVNWIVMSNRIDPTESGMGTFGKTHCRLLSEYINNNFEVVATFGDWQNDPGWAWNHGTKILKRIKPL